MLNLLQFIHFSWVKFGLKDLLCVKDMTFRNSAFSFCQQAMKITLWSSKHYNHVHLHCHHFNCVCRMICWLTFLLISPVLGQTLQSTSRELFSQSLDIIYRILEKLALAQLWLLALRLLHWASAVCDARFLATLVALHFSWWVSIKVVVSK